VKTQNQFSVTAGLLLALLFAFSQTNVQASLTWDPSTGTGTQPNRDGTGSWGTTTPANWWNGSADVNYTNTTPFTDVIFGNGGAGGTVTLSALSVNTFTFNSFSGTYTFDGAVNTVVTLKGASFTMNSGAGTVAFTTNLKPAISVDTTIDNESTVNPLTINGPISGAFNVTKTGPGVLTLAGQSGWMGSGKTFELAAGTFNINNAKALGTATGPTTTFQIDDGTTIDNTSGAAITLGEPYPITINGSFAFTGTQNLGTTATTPGAITLGTAAGTTRTITANAGTLTLTGPIANGTTATNITKAGAGTLTLSGTNTYTGNTTVSAGTLALGANGSISNSASISIAAGATFDVSAITAFALTSSNSLSASGTASAANLKGKSGGTVNLGSQPITLTYDGSHPALTILQGTLSLNGNAFTVNGTPLANGTNIIIQQTTGNITSAGTYSVTGTAIDGSHQGNILVSGGNVNLIVTTLVAVDHFAITGISATQTAGTVITNFTITAQDAGNATVTAYAGIVTFGGTAGGTGTSPAFVNGVCTNASVTPTNAGSGLTITVTDSGHAGTNSVTVNPGPVSQFTIAPNPIASATVNVPFNLTSITAKDAYGNVCSNGPNVFTGTVDFSGTAGVGGTSAAFTAGVLTSPSVTAIHAGTIIATKTGGGASGTATLTAIITGPATTLLLTSGNNQAGVLGAALANPFVVTVTDSYTNPVSGTNVTFAIASTPAGATGQSLSTTSTTSAANGQASTILTLGNLLGNYTVTATSPGLSGSPVTFTAIGGAVVKASTNNDLTAGTAWIGGTAPDATHTATWASGSLGAGLTIGSAVAWNGISVLTAASDIAITNTGPLTLGLNGIDMSGSAVNMTLGVPVALAGSQSWNVNTAKSLTVTNVVSGNTFGVTKLGPGTLTLNGSNTFSGGVSILSGTVAIGVANSTNSFLGTGAITLGDNSGNNNATLYVSAASNGTGITNALTVAAGTTGNLTIAGNNSGINLLGSVALNNSLTLANANIGKVINISGALTCANSPALTITSAGGNTGPNTLSGGVAIGNSGLILANNSSRTMTIGAGNISGSGSVTFNANSNGNFTISAVSINHSGSLTNSGTGGGTTTISGNLGSNVTNVVQNSATSALVLSGTNANSATIISLGTLVFTGGSLSNSPVTVASATTNDVEANIAIVGLKDVSGSGGIVLNNNNNSTNTLTLVGSGTYSFNGSLQNGTNGAATALALTLAGSGIQTLGGADTYTGPTAVNAGTLLVNGAISNSPVTVSAGATLGGAGAIGGATTVNAGAYLAAGTNGIGTLTINSNLTLNAGSTNRFVVTTGGVVSNKVAVAGTLSPNGSVIEISTGGGQLVVGTYTNMFTYGTTNGTAFAAAPVFDTVQTGGNTASIVDTGAGHINLVISPAITPSTNAYLAALVISNSTSALALSPGFTTNGYFYSATNAFGGGAVNVLVTNVDATATNTLFVGGNTQGLLTNGIASAPLTLAVGMTNVAVQVVSQDLTQTNTYTVALTQLGSPVSSDASLSYLAVTPGTLNPSFNTGTTNYAVTNAYAGSPVSMTVTNTDPNATNVLYFDGTAQATNAGSLTVGSLSLAVGSGNVITVVVTAQDGVTVSTNTVDVTRLGSTNALLSNLSLSPGALSQTFNAGLTSYTATNTYPATNVTVTATSGDGTAALALSFNTGSTYGILLTNGLASVTNTMSLASPANVLAVQVVSQDLSQTNVYTVNELLQPSQSVPHLTNSVSGNSLELSWTTDHLGYRLLVQTNNLNKGVSGNINDWGTVAGSISITATNIAIIKSGVTNEYYKLVYP